MDQSTENEIEEVSIGDKYIPRMFTVIKSKPIIKPRKIIKDNSEIMLVEIPKNVYIFILQIIFSLIFKN